MDCRIEEKDSFFIIGFSTRVRLQFEGENEEIGKLAARVTPDIAEKLKSLNDEQPDGILNVSANFSSRTEEDSSLDQYIGVAASQPCPDFDCLEVPASVWAVFTARGAYPAALQQAWADIYAKWLPSSGYALTGGPEILRNLDSDFTAPDFSSEIWIPVQRA